MHLARGIRFIEYNDVNNSREALKIIVIAGEISLKRFQCGIIASIVISAVTDWLIDPYLSSTHEEETVALLF